MEVTQETLEDRLVTVENELRQIKQKLSAQEPSTTPARWETLFGSFADSEGFEEAVRLGQEYRYKQDSESGVCP